LKSQGVAFAFGRRPPDVNTLPVRGPVGVRRDGIVARAHAYGFPLHGLQIEELLTLNCEVSITAVPETNDLSPTGAGSPPIGKSALCRYKRCGSSAR
jgi:hypothetical protein